MLLGRLRAFEYFAGLADRLRRDDFQSHLGRLNYTLKEPVRSNRPYCSLELSNRFGSRSLSAAVSSRQYRL